MSREDWENVMFYCWQLEIKTISQLEKFKKVTNSKDNKELLQNLAIVYNRI